jgi:beta-glucanase (GH16 family)
MKNGIHSFGTSVNLTMRASHKHLLAFSAHSGVRFGSFKIAATVFSVLSLFAALFTVVPTIDGSAATTPVTVFHAIANPPYPIGTPDSAEPSGESPPSTTALVGYEQSYVNDFTGTTVPPGWDVYSGIPGGDPGAHFGGSSHVLVSGGLLQLLTFRDKNFNNQFETGGLCQCGLPQRYGAYFVRSRVTGPGPNEVALLWPSTNVWPPEIDFSETGDSISSTTGTVHYGSTNRMDHLKVKINMMAWHTFGIIWTPNLLTFTVDGQVWGTETVAARIPNLAMTLDIQQTTRCTEHTQCPTGPVAMQVDWVAEYTAN